jgi:hypothetical protein
MPSQAVVPLPRSGFVHGGAKQSLLNSSQYVRFQTKANFARTTGMGAHSRLELSK